MTPLESYLWLVDRWISNLGPREWCVIALVGLVLGAICLRGLGSRRDI